MIKEKQYSFKIKEFQVKLQQKVFKILKIFPSINDTFVFIGMHAPGKDILVHCDKNGTILYQYKFTNPIDSLGMVQLHKVIVLQTRLNQIFIFDLSSHQKYQLNFNFIFEQSDQSDIITFSETKLICIVEQGRYNDNRFRLSYFNQNIHSDSHPLAVYESDSEWTYEHVVRKGNENSMIIWQKPRQDELFQLKQFHLQGQVNPRFNHYTCPNTIGQPYGKQKFQIAVSSVWQRTKQEFCLICITQKSNYNHENNEIINNNFIWNVSSNTIRQTKFNINPQYSQFLIDTFSIGKFSVFHTFSYHNGNAQSSPIYYVNNEEQKLLPIQRQWHCNYLSKMSFPSYSPSLYVQSEYENGDTDKFKLKIIEIVQKTK